MSRYAFSLASVNDDAELRQRMAEDWMEGEIAVSFRREPSYFAACHVQGMAAQIVTCTDQSSRKIIGLGGRFTQNAYVDGQAMQIGYLGDLRLSKDYRNGTLLARGYRVFRALHRAAPLPLYTTVIYEGNQPASRALLGGRAGLPTYSDWGRLHTPALRLDAPVPQCRIAGVDIKRGTASMLPDIIAFLNRTQSGKQFAPVYCEQDFVAGGRFSLIKSDNFFLAMRGDRIVASVAAWDQSSLRQTHVERYSWTLRCLRPFYNACAHFLPLKALPAPGERIPFLYLAGMASEDNQIDYFDAVLRAACEQLRHGPWHYAIAGLHEHDPLLNVAHGLRHISAAGRLYVVHYPDEVRLDISKASARVPYLEAGCL